MSEEVYKETHWTYQRRNLSYDCEREPNDALLEGKHVNEKRDTTVVQRLTCFQSRRPSRPRENAPVPRRPMRSKPMSMMTNRRMSVINMEMMVAILLLTLGLSQESCAGSHVERIYRWKNTEPKMIQRILRSSIHLDDAWSEAAFNSVSVTRRYEKRMTCHVRVMKRRPPT